MATRHNNPVTLTHEDAQAVAQILSEYASAQARHARRTRSEPVRWQCNRDAHKARRLIDAIVPRLYTWIENETPQRGAPAP